MRIVLPLLFKFNNSAFYEGPKENKLEQAIQDVFWEMGQSNFKDLFDKLRHVPPVSLQLSAKVLKERQKLEYLATSLNELVNSGLATLENMRKEARVMEKHKADLEAKNKFGYTPLLWAF